MSIFRLLPAPVDLLNATVPLGGLLVAREVRYGDAPRQVMDVYRPAAAMAAELSVVVWFYGGAWQSGERGDYRFVAAALARRGMVVVVPDYRLHPAVDYPAFLEDAAAAVAAVRLLAAGWGGDKRRIVLAGHSAGAYLAAMLALDRRWLAGVGMQPEALAGVVGLAGPYDFLPIVGDDIRRVFAAAPALRETQPINHVDGSNPPILLLHGEADTVCYPRNSLALAARIRAAGGRVTVATYPGVGHVGIVLGFARGFHRRCPTLADVGAFADGALVETRARAIQPAA